MQSARVQVNLLLTLDKLYIFLIAVKMQGITANTRAEGTEQRGQEPATVLAYISTCVLLKFDSIKTWIQLVHDWSGEIKYRHDVQKTVCKYTTCRHSCLVYERLLFIIFFMNNHDYIITLWMFTICIITFMFVIYKHLLHNFY